MCMLLQAGWYAKGMCACTLCYVIVSLFTVGTEGTDEAVGEIPEGGEGPCWWKAILEDFLYLHVGVVL